MMYSFGRPPGGGMMGNRMGPPSMAGGGGAMKGNPWEQGSQTPDMQQLVGGMAGGMQSMGNPMGGLGQMAQNFANKPGGGGTFGMSDPNWQSQFGQMVGQMPGGGGGGSWNGGQTTGMEEGPGRLERLRGKMQDARAGGNMDRHNRLAERRQNVIQRRQNAPGSGASWASYPGGGQSVNLGGASDSVDYTGAQPGMWQGGGGGWGGPQGFGGGNPMFGGWDGGGRGFEGGGFGGFGGPQGFQSPPWQSFF